jgi:hypothetical protein
VYSNKQGLAGLFLWGQLHPLATWNSPAGWTVDKHARLEGVSASQPGDFGHMMK